MMREIVTRYGREGLGFLWLIAEPLAFCLGVLLLWSAIKPDYEYGLRLGPFLMTGYMSLILMRHLIIHNLAAIQANVGLLYHRAVTPLHIYMARGIVEILGASGAFVVVYAILAAIGQVGLPHNILLLIYGWLSLAWLSFGVSLNLASLAIRFEVVERLSQLFTYLLIPLSSAFFMVSAVPAGYRDAFLLVPFPHTIEMVRAGVFGEFTATYWDPFYPLVWAAVLNVSGMLLLALVRDRVDVE